MCADETHVNKSNCKLNDNDEAEAITLYIEHIMLISCIVSTIKHFQSLFFTIVTHSCNAVFDSGCSSEYSFSRCSVNILIVVSLSGTNI